MHIEAQKFTIEMTHEELASTAFDVRRSLELALKEHWIYYQSDWERNETERLSRIKTMFFHLGSPNLYEEVFRMASKIFEEFNDTRGI
jgi:hypothetical protein